MRADQKNLLDAHGALLIEDAAEALGGCLLWYGSRKLCDYAVLSFNGNKIITGSSSGALLTNLEKMQERHENGVHRVETASSINMSSNRL